MIAMPQTQLKQIYIFCICIKKDLALNDLRWLICHKTQPNQIIYISLSTCRAASTDIPDPHSPLLLIIHRLWQVFRATSCILTQLLYVCSRWPSCFCSAICGGPLEYMTYELVPLSPAVSCMSGSSNLDSFRDRRYVAV